MKSSAYASLRAAFDRIERLPAGPERAQAIEELRALLRTLRGDDVREALAEANRFLEVQQARDRHPAQRARAG